MKTRDLTDAAMAANGQKALFHYDPVTNKIIVEVIQNTDAVLKEAAVARAGESSRFDKDIHRVASIPQVYLESYLLKRGLTHHQWGMDQKETRRFLNDPDGSGFRTKTGRL